MHFLVNQKVIFRFFLRKIIRKGWDNMAVTLIRAAILYITVIFLIRLMGKRQIGELQPSELVVTILVSEIASIPMQDNSIPILNSVVALFALVAFEILSSAISMKSPKMRAYMQGHPVIVIRNGIIDYKALKKLRMTVSDLISALRQKDVFDISQISYAIFETNGQISVLLKPENRNSTAADVNVYPKDKGMPFAVICDGEIIEDMVKESGYDISKIRKFVLSSKIPTEKILVMSVDSDGIAYIAGKDENS
ncbi:MAG: DUF421 domain-containing protein [Ruminococcaceae bacterium]|nr:DUF421 domain-containing protein [Oscillospiraceae bacterium]